MTRRSGVGLELDERGRVRVDAGFKTNVPQVWAIGDVIAALSQKSKHVPYRNHPLTMLMSDSIGGTAKTLMIVNASPSSEHDSTSSKVLHPTPVALADACRGLESFSIQNCPNLTVEAARALAERRVARDARACACAPSRALGRMPSAVCRLPSAVGRRPSAVGRRRRRSGGERSPFARRAVWTRAAQRRTCRSRSGARAGGQRL